MEKKKKRDDRSNFPKQNLSQNNRLKTSYNRPPGTPKWDQRSRSRRSPGTGDQVRRNLGRWPKVRVSRLAETDWCSETRGQATGGEGGSTFAHGAKLAKNSGETSGFRSRAKPGAKPGRRPTPLLTRSAWRKQPGSPRPPACAHRRSRAGHRAGAGPGSPPPPRSRPPLRRVRRARPDSIWLSGVRPPRRSLPSVPRASGGPTSLLARPSSPLPPRPPSPRSE